MLVGVTGTSGFLGRAIASRLPSLRRISRGPDGDQLSADLTVVAGCEVVVNCAGLIAPRGASEAEHQAMNCDMPVALALAAKNAGARRFVQISSVAAVSSRGEAITDDTPPTPQTPYGRMKLAADQALARLADERFSVASIRPPAIYGPGMRSRFALLNRAARMGIPLPLGQIRNLRSFAFVGNIADAILKCVDSNRSGAWILTDSDPLSSARIYRKLLALHGYGDRVFPAPSSLVHSILKAVLGDGAESLLGNAWYDGNGFAQAFDWSPPTGMGDALASTVASARAP